MTSFRSTVSLAEVTRIGNKSCSSKRAKTLYRYRNNMILSQTLLQTANNKSWEQVLQTTSSFPFLHFQYWHMEDTERDRGCGTEMVCKTRARVIQLATFCRMQAFPSCLLISQLLSSSRRDRIRSFTQAVWGGCVVCVWGVCVHACGVCVHACEESACGMCVCPYGQCVQCTSRVCVWFMIHPHVKKYASRLKQVTTDTWKVLRWITIY